jgi:hypothetical protein
MPAKRGGRCNVSGTSTRLMRAIASRLEKFSDCPLGHDTLSVSALLAPEIRASPSRGTGLA